MNRGVALLLVTACSSDPSAEGEHHQYVISNVRLPANAAEAQMFALPLQDGGAPNNKMGAALAGLSPVGLITNNAISHGEISLLLDLQTRDFGTASAAGVSIQFGENPTPTPCTAPESCGHHLAGTGTFDIAFGGNDDQLLGHVIDGTFDSGLGQTTIQLACEKGPSLPLELDLLAARVELTELGDDKIGRGIIAGVVERGFIVGRFLSNLHLGMNDFVLADCETTPQGLCGCTPGSIGEQILAVFPATTDGDCFISDEEFNANPNVQALQQSDISVDGVAGVTFGMRITAVAASF